LAIEIEAKMQMRDVPALEQRLLAAGAARGPNLLETNTFFDTPQRRLRSSDQGLRIRQAQDQDSGQTTVTITHKGPRSHGQLKNRPETELIVHDADEAHRLLSALGFVAGLVFQKRRQRWELDGCHVEIDTLPYLGTFVEIEGPSESAVLAVRQRLELQDLALIKASYASMLSDYLAEHEIRAQHVGFDDGPT
jgi:adenylate cyclase class 2